MMAGILLVGAVRYLLLAIAGLTMLVVLGRLLVYTFDQIG